jgi:hypothetical protein
MGYQLKVKVCIERDCKIWKLNCYTIPIIDQLIIILWRRLWLGMYLSVYCAYVECSCMLVWKSYIFYGSKIWSITLSEEHRLRVCKNRVLRRLSKSRMKTLHNDDLHDFCSVSYIIRMIKSQVWNPQCIWSSWVIQEML